MERFGISVGGQLLEMVRFAGVGILIGIWYDGFRLFRLVNRPSAWRVFWQDLLFFAGAAAITLLLSLPISSGRVRLFHLMALAIGFTCYYQTVGRLIYVTARWLVRLMGWLSGLARRLSDRVGGGVRRRLTAPRSRAQVKKEKKPAKSAKKVQKNLKNRLKLSRKV